MEPEKKQCQYEACGAAYAPSKHAGNAARQKFCSRKCQALKSARIATASGADARRCREAHYARRKRVIAKYDNECVCCGENRYEFLTFDHVNGDGAEERRRLNGNSGHTGTKKFLLLLDSEERRADIQILCWNCNCAKGYHGVCPHKKEGIE